MITPIEIRQHSFKKSFRGFDPEEVANFLNNLSLQWEKQLEEARRTKIELEKTTSNLESLKQVESVLHKTLLQAEETSRSTVENAKRDAELKRREAEEKSNELIKNALTERSRIELQIGELISRRNDILNQLKSFLTSTTDRIKTFEEKEMKSYSQQAAQEDPKSFFDTNVSSGSDTSMVNEIVEGL
jgi:cell division initiation protein